jgi:hypothetical protein
MTRLPHGVLGFALALALALALAGCATWQPPPGVDDAALRTQALSKDAHDVRVSATLIDAKTSEAMFGSGIDKAEVQPVWIEVENRTSQPLWLLPTGADPDYFSPLEVAWSMHRTFSSRFNASVDEHVASFAFESPIMPGATNHGVLFTNMQTGTVLLNVDLFGNKTFIPFSLFLWRDERGVVSSTPLMFQYPETEIVEYHDLAAFRAALERLPCCTSNVEGGQGDPLNVVAVGAMEDLAAATVRRNYRRIERDDDAMQRVFERAPDATLRKQSQAGSPATWLRVWAVPMHFDGRAVFVVQVGRPVGGRFSTDGTSARTLQPDVDEARNLVVQDMMYSGGLEKLGFIKGAGAAGNDAHYSTDGLRAVLFFTTRPRSLSDVELLDWEPYLERREAEAQERARHAPH